jgi:hypothetical protein
MLPSRHFLPGRQDALLSSFLGLPARGFATSTQLPAMGRFRVDHLSVVGRIVLGFAQRLSYRR